jgi:hypothetical protein
MRKILLLTAASLGLAASVYGAGWGWPRHKPACEPGYTIVEEICYKDVIKKVVRPVPDVKKVPRWVYDNRPEDFALPCCTCPKCGCCAEDGCCVKCGKPCCRAPLIKRLEYDYIPITKCEVECTVEKVPYKVYRKVPCGQAVPPAAQVVVPAPAVDPEALPVPPVPQMPRAPISAPRGSEVSVEAIVP